MVVPPEGSTGYALSGLQLEPEAGAWLHCPVPRVVSLAELTSRTETPGIAGYFPAWNEVVRLSYQPDQASDLVELRTLAGLLDDPDAIDTEERGRERLPLSYFLQLRPPPLGTVVRYARPSDPLIETPRELARYFEASTPGAAHRHALQHLLLSCNWSPPRQAVAWAALDVAIESGILAAWHYKWQSKRAFTARRPRPAEVDPWISVLYDREVSFDAAGELRDGPRRPSAEPSPGTPRHPSYPSAGSTVAAAASELLSWFFPDWRQEFDQLSDNAGVARLWAGIHFRSDHEAGAKLGRTVAQLIVEQLLVAGFESAEERTRHGQVAGRCAPAREGEPGEPGTSLSNGEGEHR